MFQDKSSEISFDGLPSFSSSQTRYGLIKIAKANMAPSELSAILPHYKYYV